MELLQFFSLAEMLLRNSDLRFRAASSVLPLLVALPKLWESAQQ
jgi:hypothetical protein